MLQAAVPLVPKPPPKIRPIPLTPQQQQALRSSAIHRILASSNAPDQATRTALLSRLATSAPAGDQLGDALLQHMLDNYHGSNGHQLALSWLFALYKDLLLDPQPPHSSNGGAGSKAAEAAQGHSLRDESAKQADADAAQAGNGAPSGVKQEDDAQDIKADDAAEAMAVDSAEAVSTSQAKTPQGEDHLRSYAFRAQSQNTELRCLVRKTVFLILVNGS